MYELIQSQKAQRGLNKAIIFKILQSQAEKLDLGHPHYVFHQKRKKIHHPLPPKLYFSSSLKEQLTPSNKIILRLNEEGKKKAVTQINAV